MTQTLHLSSARLIDARAGTALESPLSGLAATTPGLTADPVPALAGRPMSTRSRSHAESAVD